jgi:hypothetical protein
MVCDIHQGTTVSAFSLPRSDKFPVLSHIVQRPRPNGRTLAHCTIANWEYGMNFSMIGVFGGLAGIVLSALYLKTLAQAKQRELVKVRV